MLLGRTRGCADRDLALGPLRAALGLRDVRQLVTHQGRIGGALSATKEDVLAVCKRARSHRMRRVARHRIVVHASSRNIDPGLPSHARSDRRIDGMASTLAIDREACSGFGRLGR
jgi:hypothetical protein